MQFTKIRFCYANVSVIKNAICYSAVTMVENIGKAAVQEMGTASLSWKIVETKRFAPYGRARLIIILLHICPGKKTTTSGSRKQ